MEPLDHMRTVGYVYVSAQSGGCECLRSTSEHELFLNFVTTALSLSTGLLCVCACACVCSH